MCNFFSFCSNGRDYLYADWGERMRLKHEDVDSHTAILTRAGVPPKQQDRWSCYEYNPLTLAFQTDHAVEGHDIGAAHNWVEARDWKAIIEPLIIKPIVNPFAKRAPKITREHIAALKRWASVWDSVWDSVRASVRAYTSSFFTIKYVYDFSSAVRLWEAGLVPSYNGKTWRLHGGKSAKVLYEWTPGGRKEK